MTVRWTEKAFLSLERIFHHIEADNPEAATRTARNIHMHTSSNWQPFRIVAELAASKVRAN